MKKWLWITLIMGVIGFSVIFPLFVFLSFRLYPGGFDFTNDYLSYLGGFGKNPDGAIYYNIGVIIGGVSLIAIMGGLQMWRHPKKAVRIFLTPLRVIGVLEGISIIGVGIFHDGHPWHNLSSGLYGICNVALTLVAMIGFLFHPSYKKWLSVYLLGLLILTGVMLLQSQYKLMELYTIIGTCIYFPLLLWNMRVIHKKENSIS